MFEKRAVIHVLAGFGCVAVVSLLLFAGSNDSPPPTELEELSSIRTSLELSKLRLERELDEAEATSEETRRALSDWLKANADLLAREQQLRTKLHARVARGSVPAVVPSPDGRSDEEFIAEAETYLRVAHEAQFEPVAGRAQLNAARQRIAAWRGQVDVRQLLAQVEEARLRVDQTASGQAALVPDVELAVMAPADRAEAEAFNRIVSAFAEPLQAGEESRDRLEPIQLELELLQKEARRLRWDQSRGSRIARIAELEAQMTESNR